MRTRRSVRLSHPAVHFEMSQGQEPTQGRDERVARSVNPTSSSHLGGHCKARRSLASDRKINPCPEDSIWELDTSSFEFYWNM